MPLHASLANPGYIHNANSYAYLTRIMFDFFYQINVKHTGYGFSFSVNNATQMGVNYKLQKGGIL